MVVFSSLREIPILNSITSERKNKYLLFGHVDVVELAFPF